MQYAEKLENLKSRIKKYAVYSFLFIMVKIQERPRVTQFVHGGTDMAFSKFGLNLLLHIPNFRTRAYTKKKRNIFKNIQLMITEKYRKIYIGIMNYT